MLNISAFYDITINQNMAWFYDIYNDALLKMDMKTKEISFVISPNFEYGKRLYELYGCIEYYNGKIVLAPRCGKNILIYDIKTNSFKEISLSFDGWEEEEIYNLFTKMIVYKKYIYFIPGRYKSIVCLDMETLKIKYISEVYELISAYIDEPKRVIFSSALVVDSYAYFAFWQGNKIVEFDMEREEFRLYEIGNKDISFSDIIFDGTDFWLSSRNSSYIFCWNKSTNKYKIYDLDATGNRLNGFGCASLIQSKDCIYAVPNWGSNIVKFKKKDLSCELFYDLKRDPDEKFKRLIRYKCSSICRRVISNNLVILYLPIECGIFIFNPETEEIEVVSSEVNDNRILDLMRERSLFSFKKNKGILLEKNEGMLKDYINIMKRCIIKNNLCKEDIVGENIYKNVISYDE